MRLHSFFKKPNNLSLFAALFDYLRPGLTMRSKNILSEQRKRFASERAFYEYLITKDADFLSERNAGVQTNKLLNNFRITLVNFAIQLKNAGDEPSKVKLFMQCAVQEKAKNINRLSLFKFIEIGEKSRQGKDRILSKVFHALYKSTSGPHLEKIAATNGFTTERMRQMSRHLQLNIKTQYAFVQHPYFAYYVQEYIQNAPFQLIDRTFADNINNKENVSFNERCTLLH